MNSGAEWLHSFTLKAEGISSRSPKETLNLKIF